MVNKLKKVKEIKYANYMIKEIFEQPEVIKNVIKEYIDLKKSTVRFAEFTAQLKKTRKIKRIIFLGCGTSYHAALAGNYLFEELAGLNCEVELADEFKSRKAVVEKDTAIIALSQSGETADTIKAVHLAKEQGAYIISITNEADSTLERMADVVICTKAGKELAVAATKTFTSQLVILVLIAVFIGRFNKISLAVGKNIIKEIKQLPKKMKKVLQLDNNIKLIADKYKEAENFIVLGEKYNYPIALEGALKLKETAYLHAEGLATEEFEHGPIAIIDKDFLSVFIAPTDSVFEKNTRVMQKVKRAGSKVIVLTTEGNRKLDSLADNIIYIPSALDVLTPVLSVIPLQLLAYHLAVLKGLKADKPRNIAKVVKG